MSATHSQASALKAAAVGNEPFTDSELDRAIASLKALSPADAPVDWAALRELYASSLHKSHKNWAVTATAAASFAGCAGGPGDAHFRTIFRRVLEDGNFDEGVAAGARRGPSAKPWVVLVTGVNGIRKTTSVHQPWFKDVLQEALGTQFGGERGELPDGGDSFFRQLDYMVATLALEEFRELYGLSNIVDYAALKDAIFARYRTAAEMLGVTLVKAATAKGANVMVESSGRDIGMFNYIEHLYPDDEYRKLVVHFGINDLGFAERSVDARMLGEMGDGRAALRAADPATLVRANAGGPYGSAALRGVQADSEAVRRQVWEAKQGEVGHSWLKARIDIEARAEGDWSCCAAGTGVCGLLPTDDGAPESETEWRPKSFVFGPRK